MTNPREFEEPGAKSTSEQDVQSDNYRYYLAVYDKASEYDGGSTPLRDGKSLPEVESSDEGLMCR